MRIKILLGLLLVMMFAVSNPADAQHYRRHGYSRGYNRGPRAVVVVNAGPRYGGGYRRGYYGPGYRRGYYGGGYRRGYYGGGYRRGYYGGGYRRGYYGRGYRRGYHGGPRRVYRRY